MVDVERITEHFNLQEPLVTQVVCFSSLCVCVHACNFVQNAGYSAVQTEYNLHVHKINDCSVISVRVEKRKDQ